MMKSFKEYLKENIILERGEDSKGLKRSTESGAGLTRKGAKHFGVKTAVTTPPSKLKKGGKAWKRRKSFCARMSGMKGPMKDEKGRPTRKAMSLRRWNCNEDKDYFKEACWKNYKQIGMKMKGKKKVPNCVPSKEE